MKLYVDDARHLICKPYSVWALHLMAKTVGLKRCWFHSGRFAHYDVPKTWNTETLVADLRERVRAAGCDWTVELVTPRELLTVIKEAA